MTVEYQRAVAEDKHARRRVKAAIVWKSLDPEAREKIALRRMIDTKKRYEQAARVMNWEHAFWICLHDCLDYCLL